MKKIDHKELHVKYLLKLERELDDIWKKIAKIEHIELPKPIFSSYGVQWILNDTNSRYREEYDYILKKYGSYTKARTIKKAREIQPPRVKLYKHEYNKLTKKYSDTVRWFVRGKNKQEEDIYFFNKTEVLRKKIFKIYITHKRVVNPDLESRRKEISRIIYENTDNMGILSKHHGQKMNHHDDWDAVKYKYIYKALDRDFKEEIDNLKGD